MKNADGKMESTPSIVADIFHEAMEAKVNKIAGEMKEFEETEEEEKAAIQDAGIRRGSSEFNFKEVTEEEVSEVISGLPCKTSSGDDQVSYIEIKDASYHVVSLLICIISLIIQTLY